MKFGLDEQSTYNFLCQVGVMCKEMPHCVFSPAVFVLINLAFITFDYSHVQKVAAVVSVFKIMISFANARVHANYLLGGIH